MENCKIYWRGSCTPSISSNSIHLDKQTRKFVHSKNHREVELPLFLETGSDSLTKCKASIKIDTAYSPEPPKEKLLQGTTKVFYYKKK